MKAVVPEIAWHNKSPVFTVDIQLTVNNGFYRAATGGGDSHVVVRLSLLFLILCTAAFKFHYHSLHNVFSNQGLKQFIKILN